MNHFDRSRERMLAGARIAKRSMRLLHLALAVVAASAVMSFNQPVLAQMPSGTPSLPAETGTPSVETPTPEPSPEPSTSATPLPTPTHPSFSLSSSLANVTPGGSVTVQVRNALVPISVRPYDDRVTATVDQATQTMSIFGQKTGLSAIDVTDAGGTTRSLTVRIAKLAGHIGTSVSIRMTGDPASNSYVKRAIIAAASAAASTQPGADIVIDPDDISLRGSLGQDETFETTFPVFLEGEDYFTVNGTTRVIVENVALPRIKPRSLLVSDYPETLSEDGVLYTADLQSGAADRFLYDHFNPNGQPNRRIVLFAQNPSSRPALVQMIDGTAGPSPNEMEVGHLSTQRFLLHESQNEGQVIEVPPESDIALTQQELPAGNIVSSILQLREISGSPLHLTLVAQNELDPLNLPDPLSPLLIGGALHARGIYSIPQFSQEYTYRTDQETLPITIGQIPLPNLMQGQALAGDYGVLQAITVRIVNVSSSSPAHVVLYACPRGGNATGTFLIDRTMIQAHSMAPYTYYKLREYLVPPASVVRTEIVTMPEAGSSYPLQLVIAPDDGSPAPGAPDSVAY
ncbi:MAG TPA: hypothetical protein VGZ00_13320 [Candidatus Baltobacteraceae bacterium]|jgi:hypothetical protein|nr:hypothetical protein [Candidatus Baltobacteraceae bacterium]